MSQPPLPVHKHTLNVTHLLWGKSTPWAQGGPQSNTWDLWRHRWEGPSDSSIGEGAGCWQRLPPIDVQVLSRTHGNLSGALPMDNIDLRVLLKIVKVRTTITSSICAWMRQMSIKANGPERKLGNASQQSGLRWNMSRGKEPKKFAPSYQHKEQAQDTTPKKGYTQRRKPSNVETNKVVLWYQSKPCLRCGQNVKKWPCSTKANHVVVADRMLNNSFVPKLVSLNKDQIFCTSRSKSMQRISFFVDKGAMHSFISPKLTK